MTDPIAEKARLRTHIAEMLRRVPARLSRCSAMEARDFKAFHAYATQTMAQNRAPLHIWTDLYNKTIAQYK